MAFLSGTIYIYIPGPTKYSNNVLYLLGHISFPHGAHQRLQYSLMRVLRYSYHYSL